MLISNIKESNKSYSEVFSNYHKTIRFKSEDRDRFFTAAQRTLIVDEILKRTPYGLGKMAHSKVLLYNQYQKYDLYGAKRQKS